MSHAQKNNWQTTANIETLRKRAELLSKIRHFFSERGVLEVETPQLSHAIGTDPYLHFFSTDFSSPKKTLFLQTSPEFAMKRLLASGSGSIFQICKAYRNDEIGRLHNPEFTLLEWYRIGFNHHDLMHEMDELLQTLLQCSKAEMLSYHDLFETHFHFNPHLADIKEIREKTHHLNLDENLTSSFDKDTWLHYLLATFIEPSLGQSAPTFVYDFPASQALLARIRHDTPPVAERFEVYIQGIELANGFHELNDATEQKKRFKNDLQKRKEKNAPQPPLDHLFLEALPHLPPCAGVALGIDRLIMIATKKTAIKEVMSFDFSNC